MVLGNDDRNLLSLASIGFYLDDTEMDRAANIIFKVGFVLCLTIIPYMDNYVLSIRHLTWGITTFILSVFVLFSKKIVWHPIFIAFLVYWFWVTYSICFAVNQGEAMYSSCKVIRNIAFLFCAVNMLKRLNISKVVILTTIGLGLFSLFEWYFKPLHLRVGLMGMKNLCAASFVLLMILCSHYYKDWKIPSAIAIGLSLFIIISLRARSSWVALIVAGLVFAFSNRKYLVPTLCCFVIVSCVIFTMKGDSILDTESMTHRLEMWKMSARMLKDHPAGIGAGCWKLVFPLYLKYSTPEMREMVYRVETDGRNRIWGRTHNDFVQKATEIGVLGVASYITIFALALYYSKGWIRIGISAYIALSCFTFMDERASLVFLLMIFFALTVKECRPIEFKKRYALGFMVLLLLSVVDLGIRYQSSSKMAGIARARNVNWDGVISETDKISPLANLDIFGMPLAFYRGVAFSAKNDPNNAFESFKQARKANPNHLHILMNLAAISVAMGDVREAEGILGTVEKMYPDFKDVKKSMKVAEKHRLRDILMGLNNG